MEANMETKNKTFRMLFMPTISQCEVSHFLPNVTKMVFARCLQLLIPILLLTNCKAPEKMITLQKTACFGTCPVYTLDIYSNQEVNLMAEQFVGVGQGVFQLRLTQSEYDQIIEQFKRSEFFGFENRYRAQVSDLPTIFLTFSDGSRSKTIELYGAGPAALHQLVDSLQNMVDRGDWKKGKIR